MVAVWTTMVEVELVKSDQIWANSICLFLHVLYQKKRNFQDLGTRKLESEVTIYEDGEDEKWPWRGRCQGLFLNMSN